MRWTGEESTCKTKVNECFILVQNTDPITLSRMTRDRHTYAYDKTAVKLIQQTWKLYVNTYQSTVSEKSQHFTQTASSAEHQM